MTEEKPKKRCTLKKVTDVTKYELQMERDPVMRRMFPIKDTYADKKTGEVVKIDYRDGAFRYL